MRHRFLNNPLAKGSGPVALPVSQPSIRASCGSDLPGFSPCARRLLSSTRPHAPCLQAKYSRGLYGDAHHPMALHEVARLQSRGTQRTRMLLKWQWHTPPPLHPQTGPPSLPVDEVGEAQRLVVPPDATLAVEGVVHGQLRGSLASHPAPSGRAAPAGRHAEARKQRAC